MSTLLADTIRKTGGTAGVDIRVKNTSVYESDGGTSVTQNLVQGLCKAWVRYDGTNPGSGLDSLNISSITDSDTGDQRPAFTNNMGNTVYSNTATSSQYHTIGLQNNGGDTGTPTTGFRMITYNNSHAAADTGRVASQITGDLA